MSFFSRLRHSLGFSDEEILETDGDTVLADDETPVPADAVGPCGDEEAAAAAHDKEMSDAREAIFGYVVDVFNQALPDFLARSVDPETQRRFLFEKLDQGLEGLSRAHRCRGRQSLRDALERRAGPLRSEMEELKRKSEQVERDRADLKQKQLSADRQKRAMSDRLEGS